MSHVEVAKLAHVSPVVSVAWMDGDSGVVTLGETGEVSKWTRVVCSLISSWGRVILNMGSREETSGTGRSY